MQLRYFCSLQDVYALNPQRKYGTSSSQRPNQRDVQSWIRQVAAEMEGLLRQAGYVIPVTPTLLTLTTTPTVPGDSVSLWVSSTNTITLNDTLRVMGRVNQRTIQDEFIEVQALGGTGEVVADISYAYDTGASVFLMNPSLQVLRQWNALGAAAKAETAVFMGGNKNSSTHVERLQVEFTNVKSDVCGKPHYLQELLIDPAVVAQFPPSAALSSYGRTHRSDDDMQPRITIAKKF